MTISTLQRGFAFATLALLPALASAPASAQGHTMQGTTKMMHHPGHMAVGHMAVGHTMMGHMMAGLSERDKRAIRGMSPDEKRAMMHMMKMHG